ncbi:MAG: DNA polymerase I [Saprospiraceae bacterium]|nr:DNA polymerase I [Saprospiraceae bacterium]
MSDQKNKVQPTLYLIDGSGFIFRAFYAIQMMNRPDGTPVNAVFGFCNMLNRLQSDVKAIHAAVIFDAARKTFRNEIYPEYKAHRPEAPEELRPQFALVREAARAFGFPSIESEGYEADDLIATYAKVARANSWNVVIVSSDKDLMQLIREGVALQDPLKNKPITDAEVLEKFGVPPSQVIDVQALAGDSTDNIPGAPGIGVKTAAQLITEFGSLEQLLARAGEIKQPKRREVLQNFADQIRLSKKLVTLDDNVPLPQPLDSLVVDVNHREGLVTFLEAQNFKSLLARFGAKPSGAAPAPAVPINAPALKAEAKPASVERADAARDYALIQDIRHLEPWLETAKQQGFIAVDTETDSLTPSTATLVGVSLALAPGKACYIPLNHIDPKGAAKAGELDLGGENRPKQIPLRIAIEALKTILNDDAILKIGHNLKFDTQVLAQHGITINTFDDTMLMSFVLDAGAHGHGLDELAELHLNHKMISFSEVTGTGAKKIGFAQVELQQACDYAAEDADYTLRLHQLLKPRLIAEKMQTVYERIEKPMVKTVALMESTGIRIDSEFLHSLSRDFEQRLQVLEKQIVEEAGVSFNIASPKQLGEVLFEKLALPGGKKSKLGAYSTSSDVLEPLAEQGHTIVEKILDWRGLSKLKSTYTDSLPQSVSPRTGRVHTSFNLVGAATGRLSSTDPNLQNIPIRTEDGKSIRRAFIADKGCVLLSVDYSQIELRLVAEIANIAAMKQAFLEGLDIHAATAAQVFGLNVAHVSPEQRRQAKAINFGIIYGISGFGLAKQIGCTPSEANAFIKDYLNRFSELRVFMENCKQEAREKGYVTTLFGRRCHIRGINEKNGPMRNFAERQAINAPIQGTAADIMKKAMTRMHDALAARKLSARMMLQVHDELLFEVPEAQRADTAEVVRGVMESVATLSIPLVAEAGFGANWKEAH